ncbi:phage holin family protein [Rhodoligotrophos defluvii]|uniref:phage holin family protein n=1 Tax=Rhodoligotrophos defluvii TaxID=2561934 RepID=UPI0010CA0526|nr:phage holin family protein [Rhodoligotrophos defluvii]
MSAEPRESRSFSELLADLMQEATELFRTEGRLIRAELADKFTQVQVAGGSLAAGAICLLVALIVLVQALVIALSKVMEPGWAALIVGVVLAAIGAVLLAKGKKNLEPANLAPSRSAEQFRKDSKLVREQTLREQTPHDPTLREQTQ